MAELVQQCQIQAPPELVFDALTKATELREWLCDRAYTKPQPRGRYWLRWRDGTRVEGQYLALTPPQLLSFSWQAPQAPGQTAVNIELRAADSGSQLKLVHTGFGVEPPWPAFQEQCAARWTIGLANLRSVLETGVDLRLPQQPYLGVRWTPEAGGGIRVLQVLGGAGADVTALAPGDVVVGVGNQTLTCAQDWMRALEECPVGGETTLQVLRQGEVQSVLVRSGGVPRPEALLEPRHVVASVRNRQLQMQRLLSAALSGANEQETSERPKPDEWSVKEVLAHLSITERNLHHHLYQMILHGWDNTPRGDPASLPEAIASAMCRADSLPRLLDRFAQDQAETLALFAALRPPLTQHKARYNRLARALDCAEHTQGHIRQISDTLETIRSKREARREPAKGSLTSSG